MVLHIWPANVSWLFLDDLSAVYEPARYDERSCPWRRKLLGDLLWVFALPFSVLWVE
jgi:hypothetical protein